MEQSNLLILVDDQHSKKMIGCYGHPLVRTPNLDALAARGTRFANAYTPSPLCVSARGCKCASIIMADSAANADGDTEFPLADDGGKFSIAPAHEYPVCRGDVGISEQWQINKAGATVAARRRSRGESAPNYSNP